MQVRTLLPELFNATFQCNTFHSSSREERAPVKRQVGGSNPSCGASSGCSSAWTRARAWGARGRRFESGHPDSVCRSRSGLSLPLPCLGVAQSGRARGSGPRGCRFKSCHPDVFHVGSVAQLDQSARLRTGRPQVQVLPEPLRLSAPVAQLEQSARFRTERPQVRVLPGAPVLMRSGTGRPTGSHKPGPQGSTPCSATVSCRPGVGGPRARLKSGRTRFDSWGRHSQHRFCPCSSDGSSTGFVNRGSSVRSRPGALLTFHRSSARRASWRRHWSHTPGLLGSIPRACTATGSPTRPRGPIGRGGWLKPSSGASSTLAADIKPQEGNPSHGDAGPQPVV